VRHGWLTTLIVAGAVALVSAGCGEMNRADDEIRTEKDAVRIVPTFQLEGTENLPENLRIDKLGLAVSEIQLTPNSSDESVAYSTKKAMGLDFQIEDGQTVRQGSEMTLPETGDYDVSVRLEPVADVQRRAETGERRNYSLRVSGYVAGDGVVRVDPRDDGETSDGHPVPFPASPDRTDSDSDEEPQVSDKPSLPKQWTPFEYESTKSVVYTLDQVEFRGGRQILSFSFDADKWALEVVEPVAEAVQTDATPTRESKSGQSVVDVTKEIDSRGEGPEALADHMSVQAVEPGAGGNGGL